MVITTPFLTKRLFLNTMFWQNHEKMLHKITFFVAIPHLQKLRQKCLVILKRCGSTWGEEETKFLKKFRAAL